MHGPNGLLNTCVVFRSFSSHLFGFIICLFLPLKYICCRYGHLASLAYRTIIIRQSNSFVRLDHLARRRSGCLVPVTQSLNQLEQAGGSPGRKMGEFGPVCLTHSGGGWLWDSRGNREVQGPPKTDPRDQKDKYCV